MLSENYQAVAQMANLMAEWLILAGASINDVQVKTLTLTWKKHAILSIFLVYLLL